MPSITSPETPPVDGGELPPLGVPVTPPGGPPGPRLSLVAAAWRHPFWIVLPAVIFLLAGIAVGLQRTPTYSAESSLILAQQETSTAATGDLAAAYSRAVSATPVVSSVSKQLHLPQRTVSASLSASPSPSSPVIRVIATGSNANDVIRMANTASAAMRKYLLSLNRANPDSRRLYDAYRQATARVSRDQVEVDRATAAFGADPKSRAAADRLSAATATRDSHKLTQTALGTAYSSGLQGVGGTKFISPLAAASSANSDRASKLQLLGLVGLLAGLLVGLALAVLRGTALMRSATAS